MLIFENGVLLHVPKTGGTWVKAAIRNARISVEEYIVDGDPHADLSYCPHRDRFLFAFVREPLSLYQSYWRFKITSGWDPRNPFDATCGAPTFEGFVECVLRLEPAWCSRMFEDYVGREPGEGVDFVGRYESLADDLIRALRMMGASVDEQAIRMTPPVNVSTASRNLARWTPELADRVRRSEERAIVRFGYA
ncbi:MAG: sulfotransferase family 2 domain-containing protein [Vicinamibacterales bacterium]